MEDATISPLVYAGCSRFIHAEKRKEESAMPARAVAKLLHITWNSRQMRSKVQPLLLHVGAAGVCLLGARAPVLEGLRPLGLALAAAVPGPYALAAAAGAATGYAVSLPMDDSIPYLIAVVVLALARMLTGTRRQAARAAYLPALAAAVCLAGVQLALKLMTGGGATAVLGTVAESMLVFGMGYLLRIVCVTPWRGVGLPHGAEAQASLLFAVMTGVAVLTPYAPLGLNLGQIAAASVALFAALSGRERSASLVGISVCVALVAADGDYLYAGFGIAAAALAAGVFLQESCAMTALVFCGAGAIAMPVAPDALQGLLFMAELCAGAFVVYLLPQRCFLAAPSVTEHIGRATLTALSSRLDLLAGALSTVGTTLDAVCQRLPQKGESYADVCDAVTEAVCRRCPRCTACWGSGSSDAYDAFNNLQTLLQRKGFVTISDIPMPLQTQCSMPGRLTAALSTAYRAWVSRRSAATRAAAMRAALTEQYSAMSAALACLAGQVYREEMPDRRKAARLEKLFCELGAEPLEVTVSTDVQGCLHANAQLPRTTFTEEELDSLTQEASALCRCRFAQAQVTHAYATTQMELTEKTVYEPLFGACCLPAQGRISADVSKTFQDARGSAHVILCDGMGTGKAAAVDGNLAAVLSERLMTAGFGASEAARLVNVALSLKGDADSGTTLDAVTVNLYTGKANLFKAGAAASFLLRGHSVTVLEGESLPIGILGRVTGRATTLQLQEGDLLLLASDGAVADGSDWLCEALESAAAMPPQVLAQRLAAEARGRSMHPDDITIVCLQLAAA